MHTIERAASASPSIWHATVELPDDVACTLTPDEYVATLARLRTQAVDDLLRRFAAGARAGVVPGVDPETVRERFDIVRKDKSQCFVGLYVELLTLVPREEQE